MGDLWSPGYFRVDLSCDHVATLVASTEAWEVICALQPSEALLLNTSGASGCWTLPIPKRVPALPRAAPGRRPVRDSTDWVASGTLCGRMPPVTRYAR